MIRFIVTFFSIIICFVLQGTLLPSIAFAGCVPNLMLILTISLGLLRGRKAGIFAGLFIGLLYDVFMCSFYGLYALLYMYLGYGAGYFHNIFYHEDIKLPMGMIIFGDILFGTVVYALRFLLHGRLNFSYYFIHIILPECAYTILFTMIVYPILFVINRTLERHELRKARKFVS